MPRVTKAPPPPPTPEGPAPAMLDGDLRKRGRRPTGRNPKFLLAHEPDAWEVSSGMIVPKLSRYIVQDGVNGAAIVYDARGNARGVDHSLLAANLESWGKNRIPHDVDGPGTSYMISPFPGHYVDRWTTLFEGTAARTFDQQGYDEWRAGLVKRGIVAAPRRPAIEALETRMSHIHDTLAEKVAGIPKGVQTNASREADRLGEAIATIRAYLDTMSDPGTPITGGEAATL